MALELAALHAALGLVSQPSLVSHARRGALPSGMTLLLELAASDHEASRMASVATNSSPETLRKAAEFFLEQVLFDEQCDCYRVLGADVSASPDILRRHMALLMRWLHPDIHASNRPGGPKLDRSVFADRVTAAWENLKTSDRRAAYDLRSVTTDVGQNPSNSNVKMVKTVVAKPRRKAMKRATPRPHWIRRILRSLGGAR